MSKLCLFDSYTCGQTTSLRNEGNKKALEKEDSFFINGEWMTLTNFFSSDLGQFKREISPGERLQYIKGNPDFKYRNDPKKGELITIDGKELEIDKKLIDYIDAQDKLFYGKPVQKTFARSHPPRAHDNSNDPTTELRYRQFKKLSPVPNPLRELLRSVGLQYLLGKTQ